MCPHPLNKERTVNFIDLVKLRQSVRAYDDQPVEHEILERCVEAARLAPSASNSQPWKFIIIDEPVLKDKIARETYNSVVSFNKFALQAPVMVVIVIERASVITQIGERVKKREWTTIDIGIAAEHFCLRAAEEGLGTCMLGWFNEKRIKEILKISPKRTVALLITAGYPKTPEIREKKRKSLKEIMMYNKYE
jgi:nitroreductase